MSLKKKAEHIWDYYRWHVAVGLGLLIVLLLLFYQAFNKVDYDVYMVYAGDSYYGADFKEGIEAISRYADDINEDGEKLISFDQLFYGENTTMEYYTTMNMTLERMIEKKENTVFLIDGERFDILNRDGIEDMALPVSDWAEGEGYAVSVSDSAILKEAKIDTEDLYVLIGKGENNENAVKLAKELIK